MSDGGIMDIGTGVATSIGRYFSIVSFIPSTFYVLFVYLLIFSGSLYHSPDWNGAVTSLGHLGVTGIAMLIFSGIGLGVLLHPIQFALVQFFEGYWGAWPVPQALRRWRITHYQKLCVRLDRMWDSANDREADLADEGYRADSAGRVRARSELQEASRVRESFPEELEHVMPTRLGNVLRRTETLAGSQYGLDAIQAVPHLLLVAPAGHVDYVNDQRSQLDLAVRMTFMSVVAVVTALLFLFRDHFWTMLAVVPYGLAYLSYRGALVAAAHYTAAVDALVNLDRFALYQQMHLPLPGDAVAEKTMNEQMKKVFEYHPKPMRYEHQAIGGATGATEK
jgi:hypothetical protein